MDINIDKSIPAFLFERNFLQIIDLTSLGACPFLMSSANVLKESGV